MFAQGYLLLSVAADAHQVGEVARLLSRGVDVNAYGRFRRRFGVEVNAMLAHVGQQSYPLLMEHAVIHAMTG